MIEILPLEDLRKLPEAGDCDSGVYFLWIGNELQYIGMSTNVGERLTKQMNTNKFARLRFSFAMKQIPFERHTCLIMHSGVVMPPGMRNRLIEIEHAYIEHYWPPMNVAKPG